ncbi:MAG: tetratricopeptide repeat protein [Janthinobacterium lividum]
MDDEADEGGAGEGRADEGGAGDGGDREPGLTRRAAVALAGDDAELLVQVGCDLADTGKQLEALRCFERAVVLGLDWVSLNVGNTLSELGRPLEAVAAYEVALAAGEDDAHLNLGSVLEELGDLGGAMLAYRRAGEAAGQSEGFVALAHLLHHQGEPAQAEDVMQRAAAMGDLAAVGTLASWRWDSSHDVALEPLLRAGADASGAARADLGALLLATGRRSQARVVLQQGANLGQRECWLPLGNLLAGDDLAADVPVGSELMAAELASDELVDEVAAEAAYRAGIAAGDDYCYHNLGMLLLSRGDLAGAEASFLAGSAAGDELAQYAWQRMHDAPG